MARFYVGRRVKLARPAKPGKFGITGSIVEFALGRKGEDVTPCGPLPFDCDCLILWDGEGKERWQHTDQLEPIIHPGHQVISWEEMADLWTPEKVRA